MAFEELPYELLLQILSYLPDLTTLDSLLRASPVAYRLFDDGANAVDVFESVLSDGCVCDHVQVLMRQVALLRAGARPFPPGYTEYAPWPVAPGLASFRRQVIEESLRHSSRRTPSPAGFAPRRLDRDTAPCVVRGVLVTGRRLAAASLDCIDYYLHELAAHVGGAAAGSDTAPTWSEEQRCVRTLWRLQLIFDVKRAARRGTLGWSRKDLKSLEGVAAVGATEDDWWLGLQVSRFSQHWPAAGASGGERFFYHAAAHHDCYYPDVPHPEKHEHATVMEYIRRRCGQDLATRVNQGLACPSTVAGDGEVRRTGEAPGPALGDRRKLIFASAAMQYYESVRPVAGTGVACAEHGGGAQGLDIATLRQAGFALWSNQRLKALTNLSDLPRFLNQTRTLA
ncbi:F-box domain, cyclin-like protein [Cordyceps fumosorosea ARSEF 2679]|uniref:F-box domain, cyclin-like protein n=1 Tax=Cordyceps fumosorosea (strain ARSEF 2679) TaxID=1081104 RepID=A0A168DFW9_CORFA|nr:F-box domain, cyclin-like protein [Cordyceps fumosorosea ARSEF 2679]OAA72566.1 F-box domain, cyclin-like protein [Cordyceps fumosorosea ARSEF 2679]